MLRDDGRRIGRSIDGQAVDAAAHLGRIIVEEPQQAQLSGGLQGRRRLHAGRTGTVNQQAPDFGPLRQRNAGKPEARQRTARAHQQQENHRLQYTQRARDTQPAGPQQDGAQAHCIQHDRLGGRMQGGLSGKPENGAVQPEPQKYGNRQRGRQAIDIPLRPHRPDPVVKTQTKCQPGGDERQHKIQPDHGHLFQTAWP